MLHKYSSKKKHESLRVLIFEVLFLSLWEEGALYSQTILFPRCLSEAGIIQIMWLSGETRLIQTSVGSLLKKILMFSCKGECLFVTEKKIFRYERIKSAYFQVLLLSSLSKQRCCSSKGIWLWSPEPLSPFFLWALQEKEQNCEQCSAHWRAKEEHTQKLVISNWFQPILPHLPTGFSLEGAYPAWLSLPFPALFSTTLFKGWFLLWALGVMELWECCLQESCWALRRSRAAMPTLPGLKG